MGCNCDDAGEYSVTVEVLRQEDAELARQVAGFQGMSEVLDWMKERSLVPGTVDIVGQDEFEYDFLIQLEPAGRWLVFGVT
jgi:hypothetical protein